jgi:GNAT superfamily N-acetyltransferase
VEDTLRNGAAVIVRVARPDDRERIVAAFRHLDRSSVYKRFFRFKDELDERDLAELDAVDFVRDVMLVVTPSDATDIIIGGGRYVAPPAPASIGSAEVAFTVEEDWQGLGIAGRLLRHLTAIARGFGFRAFEADVLAENAPMLAVFARSGLPVRQTRDGGVVHVVLDLSPQDAA